MEKQQNNQGANRSPNEKFGNNGHSAHYEGLSDPTNRNAAKFESDSDDFYRAEDNLDGGMDVSNAGFTGSETSSDLSRDDRGAFTADNTEGERDAKDASALNDDGRSQITNDEDSNKDSLNF